MFPALAPRRTVATALPPFGPATTAMPVRKTMFRKYWTVMASFVSLVLVSRSTVPTVLLRFFRVTMVMTVPSMIARKYSIVTALLAGLVWAPF